MIAPMITPLGEWWLDRMREMTPPFLRGEPSIVITPQSDGSCTAHRRRGAQYRPVALGAVARLSARTSTVLKVPPEAELQTRHVVPTASRDDLAEMLRHELPRITPFSEADVLWDWQARPRPNERTRSDVVLTLVPRVMIAAPLATLDRLGIEPKLLELPSGRRIPLKPDSRPRRTLRRALIGAAMGLAALAAAMPFLVQWWELRQTEAAIASLRPAVAKVEAVRRQRQAAVAGQDILARDQARAGDVRDVLATLTQLLPDDTYLTDFSMRQRQIVISGRSSSASNLIPLIAAAPGFRNAAFDSPVTRLVGATKDAFSIRMEAAP